MQQQMTKYINVIFLLLHYTTGPLPRFESIYSNTKQKAKLLRLLKAPLVGLIELCGVIGSVPGGLVFWVFIVYIIVMFPGPLMLISRERDERKPSCSLTVIEPSHAL